MKKVLVVTLNIAIIAAAAAAYIITYLNRDLAKAGLSYAGYYAMLLLFAFWVITLAQCIARRKPVFKSAVRSYAPAAIACFILVSVIFISVGPRFRVLSDETNIASVARSMLYEKRTDNVTMGLWYYDILFPLERVAEKRPLMFPFLGSIVHTLLGYHVENVFILNFLALFALFFLVYGLVQKRFGHIWAVSAIVLMGSQPILAQCATSGGFDLMATLFVVVSYVSLKQFLRERSALNFQLLWVNLLMLANIRYEGVMPLVIVMTTLAFSGCVKADFFKDGRSLAYSCAALIFLPTFWQKLIVADPYRTGSPGEPTFSVTYLLTHSIDFLRTLADYSFRSPYNAVVNLIGLAGLLYFIYRFVVNREEAFKGQRLLLYISAACIAAYWVLITSFNPSLLVNPTTSRYYLLFFALLPVSALMLASRLGIFARKPMYVLILSTLIFLLYHPVSVEDWLSKASYWPREYRFVMDVISKEAAKDRGFVVIYAKPGHLTVSNYGAVDFAYANTHRQIGFNLKSHLYSNIFVVQAILYATMEPSEECRLDGRFTLEKLVERQINEKRFIRISRVAAIAK
ncbi:MAG: glycosyltransferase family 39 protein [Candidatus Omnitrophica bacterium]|nr:glycosyltransferase family 39 protein [Candidatus Omnitrophota bacterium]